jgi:hypothetical protein
MNGRKLNFRFAWNSQGSFILILAGRPARIAVDTAKDRIDASWLSPFVRSATGRASPDLPIRRA